MSSIPVRRGLPVLVVCALALALVTPRASTRSVFGTWPTGASPLEVGRRVAANFVPRPHMLYPPDQVLHYAEVCTWLGALRFARVTRDAALTERLVSRFEPLLGPESNLVPRPLNVDFAVFGAVPLELFIQLRQPRYLELGRGFADRQWEAPAESEMSDQMRANLSAGLSRHTRFWIDDMYMITMLQAQAWRATGNRAYLDRAALEAVAYLDALQQPNGLFHHSTEVTFFWGRGDGWFAAGMSELLSVLPSDHPRRPRILASYKKMMATLLKHQDADGMWHQLIDDPASWPETSSTGMFAFAFITGVRHGWLDERTYAPAARKAWLRLITYLDADGAIREVCAGTGAKNDRQYYLDRPRIVGDFHGQAPLLWCATALVQ
jgi:unsaturated rhamnogalacturonyl hydrolase